MRLTGLLAVLLFFLIVFFAAPAASYAQTANAPTIKMDGNETNPVVIFTDKLAPGQVHPLEQNDRALVLTQPLIEHGGDLVLRESTENDDLCYAMRTYVMAREDKTSDVTRMVRQTKCTPARKFTVKTADVRIERPPDAKPALK